jgi:hypothetical protein
MIGRLVHHTEILFLKGDSYRLKNHDLGAHPTNTPRPKARRRPLAPPRLHESSSPEGSILNRRYRANSQPALKMERIDNATCSMTVACC